MTTAQTWMAVTAIVMITTLVIQELAWIWLRRRLMPFVWQFIRDACTGVFYAALVMLACSSAVAFVEWMLR